QERIDRRVVISRLGGKGMRRHTVPGTVPGTAPGTVPDTVSDPFHSSAFILCLLAVVLGMLAAGCGRTTGLSHGDTSLKGHETPQASLVTSATADATGQSGRGQVRLLLDKQRYSRGQSVNVTIANGLPQPIWASDHHTSCTVLSVEQSQGGTWHSVGLCRLLTPTSLIPLSIG